MTAKLLKDEDELLIKEVVKIVHKKMDEVLRIIDALNLGRTEVCEDGVYRIYNDGVEVCVAVGDFNKQRLPSKRIKLF